MEDVKQTDEQKIQVCGIKKEPGYFYYIDKEGDVSRKIVVGRGRPRNKPKTSNPV